MENLRLLDHKDCFKSVKGTEVITVKEEYGMNDLYIMLFLFKNNFL